MSLGRPIHIWEDNIKVTPSELCLERMERNVCLNHPILYDIKDNTREIQMKTLNIFYLIIY